MEYQHAITEWLAVRGIVTGVARTGTNEQSLLSHGLAAVNGYGIGALVGLWRNERMMISASADMRNSSLYSVSPYRFVKTVFENGGLASAGDNSLLVEDDSVRNSFGGGLAYALNKWVGLTLIAQTGIADPFEEKEDTKWLFTGGVAASIDFGAGTPLPVGVSMFYIDDSFPANGNDVIDIVRTMGVTLAYTGREDFSIGADTTFQRLPLAEGGGTIDGVLFRLKLSYYF